MLKNNRFFTKIALFGVTLLLIVVAWMWFVSTPALSQDQSRINALEVDINSIESRLNRIEAQLNQLGRFESPRVPATPPSSQSNSGRNRSQLNRDQMFDRLATLVIELKQQVNKLEARVSNLESRGAARNTC